MDETYWSDSGQSTESIEPSLRQVRPEILASLEHLRLNPESFSKESKAIAAGTNADVTKALYTHQNLGSVKVAIKHLRIFTKEDVVQMFEREIYVWSKLEHPNILPLIGFSFDKVGCPLLVSEWMKNGSAWNYNRKYPNRDLIHLLSGVAEGLAYLHGLDIIHSDINPYNIVISASGVAKIGGFGGSRMITASKNLAFPTTDIRGTLRYLAYELVQPPRTCPTKESDVWAFGMTIYALLTHCHPFNQIKEDFAVELAISRRELPVLPPSDSWNLHRQETKEVLWNVCQLCWDFDPANRADMPSIIQTLRTLGKDKDIEGDS